MRRIKTNSLGARVLSGFLSLLMVVSACPVTAFADDDVDTNPIESTTIVVDEEGVHVNGEDNDGYTIVVEDESEDENVDSIPGDEDAQDQNNPDVDTPPNIEDSSDDGTDENVVIVDDQDEDSDEDAEPTEETEVDDQTEDAEEETAEPEYEYSVTLPSDKTVSEGDTLDIDAEVVAKVTVDEETEDVDYTFEFSGEGFDIETKSATSAAITFNKAGDYTLVGKLIVDDEEVASDEMTIKVNPIVVFDHYFTDIDEDLVETSDLLVKTSDSSVFTKNTNVVSNFDDVYIIECASVEEARYVYSYYVDKVDSISDMSKVISIATDENDEDVADLDDLNDGNDALAQLNEAVEDTKDTDYSDYIALIDTGADADVNFSVVGDDTSDSGTHGTRMLELIKEINPDAKVMSIRVFDGSTTDAASVYAGIKLAIENDVKIINLSLVGADVEKNAIVKEAIQEAIDKDIVVIGAAGNYNLSATKFIPGCIDDVIVIGAANDDGSKRSNSNYNADYYVIAGTTSEATAMYTGFYSAGKLDDIRISNGDPRPISIIDNPNHQYTDDEIAWLKDILEINDLDTFIVNEDGTITVYVNNYVDFEVAGANVNDCTYPDTDITGQYFIQPNATSVGAEYSGQATLTGSSSSDSAGSKAFGTVTGFTGDNLFTAVWKAMGSPTLNACCDRFWGNTATGETNSNGAMRLMDGKTGTVDYKAKVTAFDPNANGGSQTKITFDILFKDPSDAGDDWVVNWTSHSASTTWRIETWLTTEDTGGVNMGHYDYFVAGDRIGSVNAPVDGWANIPWDNVCDSIVSKIKTEVNYELKSQSEDSYLGIRNYSTSGAFPTSSQLKNLDWGTATNHARVGSTVSASWDTTNDHQIYHSRMSAWHWNYVYVDLVKNATAGTNGSYYFADDTKVYLYRQDNGLPVYDKDGNQVYWDPDSPGHQKEWTLMYVDYHDTWMIAKETSVGFGYAYGNGGSDYTQHTSIKQTGGGGSHTTFTLSNSPMYDPVAIRVRKISNNAGDITNSNRASGDITVNGAEFTLYYYNVGTNCEKTGGVIDTHVFTSRNVGGYDGVINLRDAGSLPVGYYELKETKAPAGMSISNKTYSIYVLPEGCTPGNPNNSAYHVSNNLSMFMYDGSGHNGTWIYQCIATHTSAGTPTVNSAYKDSDGFATINLTDGDDTSKTVNYEVWYPMGLLKADTDLDQTGHHDNATLKIPEGNSPSYAGAQWQLFSTTNRSDYFNCKYDNPNGEGNNLTFGSLQYSVDTIDGFDQAGSTSLGDGLYPVQYKGNDVIITTDNTGWAQTSMLFPYGNDYRWVEIKAPVGYQINTHIYAVSENDWYENDNSHKTPKTLENYSGNKIAVVKVTETSNRDGAVDDAIYRYGFAMWKKDLTNSNDTLGNIQGDDSLNGIRFAVINRSTNHIVMRDQYNTVDSGYCAIVNGKVIESNQICAILTTHTHNGIEGYLTMYGLPYGEYDIVELRYSTADASTYIGRAYDNNGMSSISNSTYANNKGILWDGDNYFSVDYTTDDNILHHSDSAADIAHFTWTYTTPTSNPDHIAENKAFVDGFQGYKLDEEYLQVTEGDSNANGIRFAVINRSAKEVEILQSDIDTLSQVDPNWNAMNSVLEDTPNVQFIPGGTTIDNIGTGNDAARIQPGQVVAILTTHDGPQTVLEGTFTGQNVDGYFAIYGLPYGTYDVVELRRDAVISVGQDWDDVDKGTSIYANDSFYWNNTSIRYDLTDINHSQPHNDVVSALNKHIDSYTTGESRYKDDVFRDGFSFWKRDLMYNLVSDHPQGDSTWNDIRYVVVNKSDDNVKMFDKYTQMMPAADQPYVEIKNNEAIAPGCVVAILTSHQKSGNAEDELTKGNEQGYVALFGLPYGRYEIYELRADATIEVGDRYEGSNKLGQSPFANYVVNSQIANYATTPDRNGNVHPEIAGNRSMLWRGDIYFRYTLTDTGSGSDDNHTGYTENGRLVRMGDLHEVDDNNEDTWDNETAYGNITIHKIDRETAIEGKNQGANKLDHVQFAVVNRSYWSICYPYEAHDDADRYFEPNEVIAVIETDETGTCHIDHLPYGTYEVYELRINDSYNTDHRTINLPNNNGELVEVTCYGNTIQPHFVWNDAAMEAYKDWQKDYAAHEAGTAVNGVDGQEGMYFGTDDRANEWYTWNEYIEKYFVVQPEYKHKIGSNYETHTEDDYTIRGWKGDATQKLVNEGPEYEAQTVDFYWYDLPIRGDFKMQKVNIDGDLMAYVPWLVSLVETDENGQPIQNADGSYNVIEEHVIVLDFDSLFDSRNWEARPKTLSNVNQYDSYVSFDDELNKLVWTGSKQDLIDASTGNIWFGNLEDFNTQGEYFIKERGALLAGTYVIQEIPRTEKYGFPKDGDGARTEYNLGNGKTRTVVWNTEDYDMISSTLRVVHDNPNPVLLLDDFDIGVDVPLTIKSEAIDAITETNSIVPDTDSLLRDTVTFGGLNTSQRYGYKTYIWRCAEDGTPIEKIYESDMATLDFTGDKYTDPDSNREYNTLRNADPAYTSVMPGTFTTANGSFTIVDNGYKIFRDTDGNFTQEYAPEHNPTNDRFNVLYDLSIIQDFNVDTSMCLEGEKVVFAVDLYKSMGSTGWSLVKQHNENLDEKTQTVGIIKFVTESTDKTTRTRVAGLGGYVYDPVNGVDYPLVNNAAQTGNLVYNADGEIVGYTLIDDKIVYTNLGDKHNYRFQAKLTYVGEDGLDHVVKDIYGNDCQTDLVAIYIDKDLDHVVYGTDIVAEDGSNVTVLQHSLEGPCDGEITFSDLGMMDWIIPNMPNDAKTVYIKTYLYDARGPVITCHNFDLDKENENIRWLQIETTAMSEDGDQGVLPNGRSWNLDGEMIKDDVILRDRIDYSNLAESVDVRVEGYVYLVGYNEDGTRFIDTNNGLDTPYVAHESKNFTLTDVPEGSIEMQYTVKDSGQYAKRELVVCERVYMDLPGHAGTHADGKYVPGPVSIDSRSTIYKCLNCGAEFTSFDKAKYHERFEHHHTTKQIVYGQVTNDKYYLNDDGDTEVLIALHEDINDEMQTVSIPEIETHLVNKHEGTEYKVVSRTYADVTVYDTVTYRNLKVNELWNVTAELMDQETKQPVLDADGNPVTATVEFTPTAENSTIINGRAYGEVVVPITFKQVLTALDWESDPSWVCFETLRFGESGHSDFKYAVHNNIFDERQTVHLPTFRTTVTSTVTDGEDIATAVNSKDRQILAAPNQVVTDTVEIKNVGLDTVIKSDLENFDNTITDIIPSTFTLKIAAVDAENGEPIVDASGKQFTATKTFKVDVKRDADGKVITPYVITIDGKENTGAVHFEQHPDGNGTNFNVLLLGTDEKPILVDIDLNLDATNLKGKTIMFAETLYFGDTAKDGAEVLIEDDYTKVEQQVTVPEIHTTAVNPETGDHTITVSGNNAESDEWYLKTEDLENFDWKIKDTVSMNNITPNTDFTLITVVMNKETGKLVTNKADGSIFVQYTNYTSPATAVSGNAITCECGKDGCCGVIAVNDEFDIELNLNKTDARDGGTFVVYEYMVLGKDNTTYVPDITKAVPTDCYAYHNDIEDVEQTVVIPSIKTTILDSKTTTHVVPLDEDATVTDTVTYKGLVEGKEYTMECVLMDKTTGQPIKDEDGNIITKTVPFTAGANGEGEVLVTFTISAKLLHDFDEFLDDNHLDVDKDVSAVGPAISVDEDGTVHESGNTVTHVDNIEYNHDDARDEHGVSENDVERVSHGTRIVAFERCLDENGRVMAIHGDIEDEDQTILIPRIFTHLTDTVIGDHVSRWNTKETITDTVTFVSLQADKEYTISGYLINVDTNEPVLDKDGNKITATKTFIPNELPDTQVSISDGKLIASGNVDLVFTFDSTALKGTHVVAFEDCYYEEIRVATHSDITDEWQWMFVPEIGTTADGYVKAADGKAEYREKVVPYGETAQIVDVVEYNKLLPGVWYEMSGTLMDKATGKAITDKDGKAITATTRFMPAEPSGKVEVIFTLDTTGLEGKTLVAFEECLYVGAKKDGTPNKEAVAEHKDIDDKDQTVYCPKIRTTVKDSNGNTNVKLDGTQTQTIIDTVTYENLVPGKEYTVTGKLVFKRDYGDSKDYEYVKDANGNIITASTPPFKPETSNGTVDVKFEFNAALTAGREVVVFEDLYVENVRVATHSDINDENQTFDTSMKLHVKLVKSDFDNHEYVLKNAEISIYVDENCTQLAKDINGNDCVGMTNEKGEVEFIIITYDENQIFYAKETKAPFGYKICEDVIPIKGTAYYDGATNTKTTFTEADMARESDGVCAINLKMFDKIIIIPPKTGDNLPILAIMILSLLGVLCIGAFFATKRKKVVAEVDSTDNVEEMDEEEVMDAVTGMMTEEIDGDGHNDSGF